MKQYRKWILNTAFFLLVLAATLYFVLRKENPAQVAMLMQQANAALLAAALALVVGYLFCESYILYFLLRGAGAEVRFFRCVLYTFTGSFFNCITPSATGGQPMQVYLMRHDGIVPGLSIPVLMLLILLHKAVLILVALGVLIFRPAAIWQTLSSVIGWFCFGLGLNIAFSMLYLLLIFAPKLMRRWLMALLGVFLRHAPHEKKRRWYNRLFTNMENYHAVAQWIKCRPASLLPALGLKFLQRGLLFAVPQLCLLAFGVTGAPLWQTLVIQALICLAADMTPLPGGSGVNEGLFLHLMQPLCGAALVLPVTLLSRGVSFYGQIILGGIVAAATMLSYRRTRETVSC